MWSEDFSIWRMILSVVLKQREIDKPMLASTDGRVSAYIEEIDLDPTIHNFYLLWIDSALKRLKLFGRSTRPFGFESDNGIPRGSKKMFLNNYAVALSAMLSI